MLGCRRDVSEKEVAPLYRAIVHSAHDEAGTHAKRLDAFMALRALLRPEYRHTFSLAIHEEPNGHWGYSLSIDGETIYSIARLNEYYDIQKRDDFRAQQHHMELEKYFSEFNTHRVEPRQLITQDGFFIRQRDTSDCDVLAVMIGFLSSCSFRNASCLTRSLACYRYALCFHPLTILARSPRGFRVGFAWGALRGAVCC